MTDDDRERILAAEPYPVELADGITVELLEDEDGYRFHAEEGDRFDYVGTIVRDPATGVVDSLWGTGVEKHWSGERVRRHIIRHVLDGNGGYDLLGRVRRAAERERNEAAEWAARGVVTL